MPFYRSVLAGGGSGGGGNSPYVTLESNGALPGMHLGGFESDCDENITKITFGNKIISAEYFCGTIYWQGLYHNNFNATIDLSNATSLCNLEGFLDSCSNFNAPVIFPLNIYGNHYDIGEGYRTYISFPNVFNGCVNYNQPTTIRIHEISTANDEISELNLQSFFGSCLNLNSRVVLDFDKANKNISNIEYTAVHYDCSGMFTYCENFNQPMYFPLGLTNVTGLFYGCNNFNQPVVFDLGTWTYGLNFASMFDNLPAMSSDIIFLNSDHIVADSNVFTNMIYKYNTTTGGRNAWINVFIENCTGFLANNIVAQQPTNSSSWTKTYSSTYGCNIYSNDTVKVNVFDSVDWALNNFNNYYNNFYNLG